MERIVVIEDTAELFITKSNTFEDLLKSALRWRPDRINLGGVRGIEARTLLDFLTPDTLWITRDNTREFGAKGFRRFANLVMRSHQQATIQDIEAEIGESVDFVVHIARTGSEIGPRSHSDQMLRPPVAGVPLRLCFIQLNMWALMPKRKTDGTSRDNQVRQITATIRLEESSAAQVDQHAAFIQARADDVINHALEYVFISIETSKSI